MSAPITTAPPLECRDLTVSYGAVVSLAGVSLTVGTGRVVALLGRNGAGKSTLVRCLLGQQRPDAGTARLFGKDAWMTRTASMRRVGVVPEEPDAPPEATADELLRFSARLYERWDAASATSRLARFGVPRNVPAGRLSKGQKAQLALALALSHAPELLVLDDPTLGLDVVARRELYEELIGELAERGTTVFITTHDLAGIEGIAERVGILSRGRLVVDEELESLKARFRRVHLGPRAVAAGSGGDVLAGLGAVLLERPGWGAEAVLTDFDEHAFARSRPAWASDAEVSAMSLEEIFVAVLGAEKEVAR